MVAGKTQKRVEELKLFECQKFKELYQVSKKVSISTYVTWTTEVKRLSKKTNPNIYIVGTDENYLNIEGYNLEKGRNFTSYESRMATDVAIVGSEITNNLFEDNEEPLNQDISFYGKKYKIIGIIKEEGAMGGSRGSDRSIIIPLESAIRLNTGRTTFWYYINTAIDNPDDMEYAISQATGLMRKIRQDRPGEENTFEINRNLTLEEELNDISSYLKIGAFMIGFIIGK